jgi:RimJ/RimL family protein N-acetyltransferase
VIDHSGGEVPDSEEEYAARWARIVEGSKHYFVIVEPDRGRPIGCADVRVDSELFRGEIGLFIGESSRGRGIGSRVIAELVSYGFGELGLHRLDAVIFTGNWASRRAFEKNGFELEGTLRGATLKAGVPRDEWILGLVNGASRFGLG